MSPLTGDREFESISLQRRVYCEPDFRGRLRHPCIRSGAFRPWYGFCRVREPRTRALAIKVSFPRPQSSGSKHDSDVYGGQQYAPLLGLEVPG